MSEDTITDTIRPGSYLKGDAGVAEGALVLMNKMVDEYTDVILCCAPKSVAHPFVVWTYNLSNGACSRGDYYETLEEALERYNTREW